MAIKTAASQPLWMGRFYIPKNLSGQIRQMPAKSTPVSASLSISV